MIPLALVPIQFDANRDATDDLLAGMLYSQDGTSIKPGWGGNGSRLGWDVARYQWDSEKTFFKKESQKGPKKVDHFDHFVNRFFSQQIISHRPSTINFHL